MWIFTDRCFLAVVEHRQDPNLVLIRARFEEDLVDLKNRWLPTLGDIRATPGADYEFRAPAPKKDFGEAMLKAAMEIDYPKFKPSVTKNQGMGRHDLYLRVWSTMLSGSKELARKIADAAKGVLEPSASYRGAPNDEFYQQGFFYGTDESEHDHATTNLYDRRSYARIENEETRAERSHLEAIVTAQLRGTDPDEVDTVSTGIRVDTVNGLKKF